MKLSELNPTIVGVGGHNQISFDCPRCGKPYRIVIDARFNTPPAHPFWCWCLRGTCTGYDITISPSINNHHHGKKKACGCHVNIVDGEVTDA